MPRNTGILAILKLLALILIPAALVYAALSDERFARLLQGPGIAFVLLGGTALCLAAFSATEIASAIRHAAGRDGRRAELETSRTFWTAAARNMLLVGVLGSVLHFIMGLGSSIQGIASRMISAFLITLYGMVLAVLCFIPALKLAGRLEGRPAPGRDEGDGAASMAVAPPATSLRFEHILGYLLFVAVLWGVILVQGKFMAPDSPVRPAEGMLHGPALVLVVLHGPALLFVAGGAIALSLFMGPLPTGRSLTLGFAVTGVVGSLAGFIQALLGMAEHMIGEVSAAITFVLSCCFLALLGISLLSAPLEDRAEKGGAGGVRAGALLSRSAWVLFPLLTLLILMLTFVLVITPIQKVT